MSLKNMKAGTGKSSSKSIVCILCLKLALKPSSRMSFHKFPVCPKKRQIWLNRCGLTSKEVLPNHKICSFHFKPSCFKSSLTRRRLSSDAEPTIFKKDHAKITNIPFKNVKGKPKILNMKGISDQYCQSRDISPIKAVEKKISSQNRESYDIPFTRAVKKKLAGKNSQHHDISPIKADKKKISGQNSKSCDIPLTRTTKRKLSGQHRKSCDIPPTKVTKIVTAVQNSQSRDILPIKAVNKRNSRQNREYCEIASTRATKKELAGKTSQSCDIPPIKAVKKGISGQNRKSCDIPRDIASIKAVKKRNSCQNRFGIVVSTRATKKKSCDIPPTKVAKIVIDGQNSQSYDISPIKTVQKENPDQNCVSTDTSPTKSFEQEVFERSLRIIANQRRELERLDGTIAILKKKKSFLLSQLKIANNLISLDKTAK